MRAIVTWMMGAMLLLSGLYCEAAEPSASLETLVRRGLEASSAPPEELMLFLVFVLPDGTIDDWTWRPAREDDPTQPEGIKREEIWPMK